MLNFSLEYVYEQYVRIPACPVNWRYRLCQLYLSWVGALQPTNMCPGYVSKPGGLENMDYTFIPFSPSSTLTQVVVSVCVPV